MSSPATLTMRELTAHLADDAQGTLLDDWLWLVGEARSPFLVTAFGNAFLMDGADGTVHALDAHHGTVEKIADSIEEFDVLIRQPAFVRHHFPVDAVAALRESGQRLADGQVYSFVQPLAIGGEAAPANIHHVDLHVHFTVLGRLHRELAEDAAADAAD